VPGDTLWVSGADRQSVCPLRGHWRDCSDRETAGPLGVQDTT